MTGRCGNSFTVCITEVLLHILCNTITITDGLQEHTSSRNTAYEPFVMTITIRKTEVMKVRTSGASNININDDKLK